MDNQYRLEILASAQRELEEIARIHYELVGPLSARSITDRIYAALEKLKSFPNLGIKCRDNQLAAAGYRMLICGNHLCFYRNIGTVVYIYHIVDGRADYPKQLSDLKGAKSQPT
jgi:plasmid stabilization system protein ParE